MQKGIVVVYSDRQRVKFYSFDFATKETRELSNPYPWLNENDMAEMKPVKYQSRDGLTIHGYLTLPKGIEAKNLPEVWNQKYKEYLGVDVPSDAQGVLQDIHWSHGAFGYFPTYSLGSFYAAQFFSKASEEIPDLKNQIEMGNMKPLLDWLRSNIHQYGKLYTAEELCKKVTGEKLNFTYFMNYAKQKFGELYGLVKVAEYVG